uniref:(California timema) hypothetical protein n=1 Tax=Timema californicum TaxID=61474 RepID=A0A7R9JI26_TIMCA|nr:unnamed protein product [Timema californicum]
MNPNSKIKNVGDILLNASVYMKIKFILALIFPDISFLFKIRLFSTKAYKLLADILKEVLSQRKINGAKNNDFLQFLLQIKDGLNFSSDVVFSCHGKSGRIQSSNESDTISLAVSFFTEAFEKSSAVLSAILLELASNEDIQETLRKEIDTAREQNSGGIGFDMIQGMKYHDMVLSADKVILKQFVELQNTLMARSNWDIKGL